MPGFRAARFPSQPADGLPEFHFQSDISRLRSIVIHSLYSQKDVFARELLSNSNDALEKLRLVSLKDRSIMEGLDAKGGWQGNITLEARKYEDKPGGQLILRGKVHGRAFSCYLRAYIAQLPPRHRYRHD
jgi:hypothetical protein